jgi:hypothetical protein
MREKDQAMPSTGKTLAFAPCIVFAVCTYMAVIPAQVLAQAVEGAPVANYGFIWDGQISYSGTPQDDAQWRWLRAQGVETIVTLDHNRINFGKFGFENFLWIPLDKGVPPTKREARRILKFVQDPDHQPAHIVFADGNDRIAMMSALIRYAIDGQTMEAALAEARLNEGQELSPAQVEWLHRWAAEHQPGSHR